MRMENEETCGGFNMMDMSLEKYCEGYITKGLRKNERRLNRKFLYSKGGRV